MEIAEGLWQLRIPMRTSSLGYTCSYLLVDAATLIDTGVGTDEARSALKEQLRGAGLKVSEIERVIITHLHHDHVGLVGYIKSASGAEIYAHQRAEEILKFRTNFSKRRYDEAQREVRTLGESPSPNPLNRYVPVFRSQSTPYSIDKTLSDGEPLKLKGWTLRVFWTPGHASEHICLYDAERRLLFSGDHILSRITPHISLHTYEDADPLGDYLNSLEKLRGLPVELVLPAHEHIIRDLEGRIEEIYRHHEERCNEIKTALKEGERTVYQISSQISWNTRPWPLMTSGTRRMAAAETLAHLVYLRNRGEIEERVSDDVLYYRLI